MKAPDAEINLERREDAAQVLESYRKLVEEYCCTLAIVDHFLRGVKPGRFAEFGCVAGSATSKWIRNWVLVNRKGRFVNGSGFHRLMVSVSGKGVVGADLQVTVNEGRELQSWDVITQPAGSQWPEAPYAVRASQAEGVEAEDNGVSEKLLAAVLEAIPAQAFNADGWATVNKVRKSVKDKDGKELGRGPMTKIIAIISGRELIEVAVMEAPRCKDKAECIRIKPTARSNNRSISSEPLQ
jgi:hypothetical protein